MKTQELKAQFCKTHFIQLKTFISNTSSIPVTEEDVMLAIEEFFHITAQDTILYAHRNELFQQYFSSTVQSEFLRVDEETLQSILTYFGIPISQHLCLFSLQQAYRNFMKKIDVAGCINMLEPADSHLFTYMRLICLLRIFWRDYKDTLSSFFIEPPSFVLPEQPLQVVIKTEQPVIFNKNGEQTGTQPCHQGRDIAYIIMARKYEAFHVDVTFGQKEAVYTTVSMSDMLIHHHWHPIVEIMIPAFYPRVPIQWQIREDGNKC